MTSRRRTRRWPWYLAGVIVLASTAAGYAVYSPRFLIREVQVSGLETVDRDALLAEIPTGNLFLFDSAGTRERLLETFPQFSEAVIAKRVPATISVVVAEREPRGIWCQEDCQFWDESGARWGSTAPSVGPLLLQVRDERSSGASAEEEARLLAGMLAVINGLRQIDIDVRTVTLPDAEPGGMRITTAGRYDLLMDGLGDITDQLSTLEVFLADKAKDTAFNPVYIDLRTPGRIYYK